MQTLYFHARFFFRKGGKEIQKIRNGNGKNKIFNWHLPYIQYRLKQFVTLFMFIILNIRIYHKFRNNIFAKLFCIKSFIFPLESPTPLK